MEVKIPFTDRLFRTDIGTPSAPNVQDFRHSALGDIRLFGRYTGFSSDMSTGLKLGSKLPTGDWTYRNFDRDSSIGTGTTDLLLGGYHLGYINPDHHPQWFAEALLDRAFKGRAAGLDGVIHTRFFRSSLSLADGRGAACFGSSRSAGKIRA